jgi:hypothetical protein
LLTVIRTQMADMAGVGSFCVNLSLDMLIDCREQSAAL